MAEWHRIITSPYTGSMSMSGSFNVDGNATITGNVTINGTASVENLIVKQIGYSSGSNQLGDAINDVQSLYGTVVIPTGSLVVNGNMNFSGSRIIQPLTASLTTKGPTLTVLGGLAGATSGNGGDLVLKGGNGINTGNTGGDVYIQGGDRTGAQRSGNIVIGNTSNDYQTYLQGAPIFNWDGPATANAATFQRSGGTRFILFDDVLSNSDYYFRGGANTINAVWNNWNSVIVRGKGTTSSTTAFQVQNANASSSLLVTDDRLVTVSSRLQVGTFTPSTATGSSTIFTTGRISAGGGVTVYNPINNDNNLTGIYFNNNGLQIFGGNAGSAIFSGGGGKTSGYVLNVQSTAFNPSSGTGTVDTVLVNNAIAAAGANSINYNYVTVSPSIAQGSFGTGTIRGFYFAPGISSLNTSPLLAFESTRGDVVIGGNAAVTITGSFTVVTGSSVEFQVGQTGVKIGNAATDSHAITGSVAITASAGTGSALTVYKSGSTVVDVQGSSGQLFSVTDSLSGSLFSVNTAAGLPTIEAFSDNTVNIGKFGTYPIKVVSLGTSAVVSGSFSGSGADLSGIPASAIVGLNLSRIATGSVTASVGLGTGSFSIVSGSSNFLFINNSGNIGVNTSTPFSDIPTVGTGSVDLGGPNSNITVGGFTVLGKTTANGYGAVGGNYYLDNFNALRRRNNDWVSAITFNVGGFDFQSATTGGVGSSVSLSTLAYLNNSGNFTIGNGSTTLGARIGIKGSGATSSTTSLLVQNSAGTELLKITDDGFVTMATNGAGVTIGQPGWAQFRLGYITADVLANTISFIASSNNYKAVFSGDTIASFGFYFGGNSTAHASSLVELSSTTKGFLLTRHGSTSAISSPTQGLQTYITSSATEGLYYYNSGSYQGWTRVLNNTGSQSISGSLELTSALTASSAIISGNVTVLGTASINTLIVNQTQLSTGSNQLGDAADDFQTLYGTVRIPTGSLTVTGSTNISGSFTVAGRGNTNIGDIGYSTINLNGGVNVSNTGPNTGTSLSISGGGNTAMRFDWDNINNVTTVVSSASRILRFTGASQYQVRGSGATSSTTALLVQNSNASSSLAVLDNGNVGIGTASPNAKLDIRINQANTTTVPYLNLINDASGYVGYTFSKVGSNDLGLYNNYAVPPAMVWKYVSGTNSYVGINTASPAYTLDVSGSGNFTSNLTVTGSFTVATGSIVEFQVNQTGVKIGNATTDSHSITGSLAISASAGTGSALTVYKSGSTVMSIQGSQGELFSITDSLSGSLFSVSNVSGLPILEVFSDNTTLVGDYLAPALITTKRMTVNSGSTVIYSLPTASYDGAFFDYTIKSGSNARAGSIFGTYISTTASYTDTSTFDIGDTTGVAFALIVSGSNMVLTGSASTSGWALKTIIRSI